MHQSGASIHRSIKTVLQLEQIFVPSVFQLNAKTSPEISSVQRISHFPFASRQIRLVLGGQALCWYHFVTLNCKHGAYTTSTFMHFDYRKFRVAGMKSPSLC